MKCDDMYKDGKSGIRYNWHGNYYLINGEKPLCVYTLR